MLRVHANDKGSEMGQRALEMTCHTLKMMGKGGIHDHVAQVNTMWCSLQEINTICDQKNQMK